MLCYVSLCYVILCYPPRLGKLDLESGGTVAAVCLGEGLCENLRLKQHMRQRVAREYNQHKVFMC